MQLIRLKLGNFRIFFFLAYKPDAAPAGGRDAELQPGEEPAEGGGTEAGS